MQTEQLTQESIFFERCWKCRCVVPNGLVQRDVVKTGYETSCGHPDRYETVSLCGVCVLQMQEEERERGNAQARRWGVFWGTVALSFTGILWPISLGIMLLLARYRMVGRALIAMAGTSLFYSHTARYPAQLWELFVLPWAVAMGILVLWQVRTKLPRLGLNWKRPIALERRAS